MAKFNTLKTKTSKAKMSYFLDTIKEFNKIANVHRFKILEDKILFYTIQSEEYNKTQVNVMKCIILDKNELFDEIDSSFKNEFIIPDGKKFYQKFAFLQELDDIEEEEDKQYDEDDKEIKVSKLERLISEKVTLELVYTEDAIGIFRGINDFAEVKACTAEKNEIMDLNLEIIKTKMNPQDSLGQFKASTNNIKRMLKLSKIDKDNKIIELEISNKQASFSEAEWKVTVDKHVNHPDTILKFNKDYLNYLQLNNDYVLFNLFETYIIVKENNNYLLLNIELE